MSSFDVIPVPDGELDRLLIDMKFRRFQPYLRGRILDVGCGVGVMTRKLYDSGFEVEGIDGSQERIEVAMNRVPEVTFYPVLFQDFRPEPRDLYDTIILSSVLEHLTKKEGDQLLIQCRGWLKRNGTIICAVPNSNALHKQVYGENKLTEADKKVGHKRIYDILSLKRQVVDAQFIVTDIGGVLIKPDCNAKIKDFSRSVLEGWYNISNKPGLYTLCSVVYVVAKK